LIIRKIIAGNRVFLYSSYTGMTMQLRSFDRTLDKNTPSRNLKSDHEQADGNNQ
jgi:hypothetical protein